MIFLCRLFAFLGLARVVCVKATSFLYFLSQWIGLMEMNMTYIMIM